MKTKRSLSNSLAILISAAVLAVTSGISHAQDPASGQYSGRLPFWGAFPDDTHLTNGFLCLKVSVRQAISGTVAYAGHVYRLRGVLTNGALAPVTVTKRNAPSIEIEITSSDEFGISGQVRRAGEPEWVVFDGGHALQPLTKWSRANPFPYEGLYTVGMEQYETDWMEEFDYGYDVWPDTGLSRYGYLLMKVTNTGIARYKGQLPDGTKFTGANCSSAYAPWPGASVLLDHWIYGITNRGAGSVAGNLGNFEMHGLMDPDAPVVLSGSFRWYPDPTANPPKRTWLSVEGAEYNPPAEGERILGGGDIVANLLQDPAAHLNTVPGGINVSLTGPLEGAPAITRPLTSYSAVLAGNGLPVNSTIYFKPKEGSYKAIFFHPGTGRRTTAYGAVVQYRLESVWVDDGMGGFEEQTTVPGFGSGVFVSNFRDRTSGTKFSYPGWVVFDTPTGSWSHVGDFGNTPDIQVGAYGAVSHGYYIGTYEVTNAQYAEFLNAVDPLGSNSNSLYNSNMATAPSGGIAFNSGGVDGEKYEVRANMGNKPVTFVSMLDAQRFANWMHNGQGSGSTESGAYEIGALAVHNPNALFWIPTGNEWYKAAFYDPTLNDGAGGYWRYPTKSNDGPDTAFATPEGDISNPGANIANYNYRANWNGSGYGGNVTTVGSVGPLSTSHYGTFDQAGNVYEWTEEIAGSNRRAFGGSYEASGNPPWFPLGSERQYWSGWAEPSTDYASVGFRLARAPSRWIRRHP